MEQRQNYKWNWTRVITSMLRPERWLLIMLIVSMTMDNFKSEYGDKAYVIWTLHLVGMVICVFADVLKKRLDNSNFKVTRDGVEVTRETTN
jgi:uncharacterized membrane protein YoaT (DUF817 family)